jgi:cytochrome c oxidase subunit 2
MRSFWSRSAMVAGVLLTTCAVALAQEAGVGQPAPWQLDLQGPVTPIAEGIRSFHSGLFWVITAITLFVLALLIYCVVKFNERANPVPSRTTHNVAVEVAWTVIPVLILVGIAIPSFQLLKQQETLPKADVTIKVTGYQWYWGVDYVEAQAGQQAQSFKFDVYMLRDANNVPIAGPNGAPRTLAVDNEIVVPVNANVVVQVTAGDVLHSFAMPSLGIKRDAVPGRLNQTWFRATREGVYYGQCSELCGVNHAYMPAAIRVVSADRYASWLTEARQKFATAPAGVRVADNATDALARQ